MHPPRTLQILEKKKGSGFRPKPMILLVAGTGFEPVTFGL
jgi:hypothetical protein